MANALDSGESGVAVCRALSLVYDEMVARLWRDAFESDSSLQESGFALVATGGWGREEMCPYSDIDFIVLTPGDSAAIAQASALAESILYPLWDAKIKVGHAVRTVSDAAKLARDDLPTATALLDARLVVGDKGLFTRLVRTTRSSVAPGGNANAFMGKLRDEQKRRHERFGDSLHLLEPNIKQGIGGLRDYNTAHWAARARWSVKNVAQLLTIGGLSMRQTKVMQRGLDFMLKLRCWVQLEAGRATDQLSFEIQEAIGPKLFPDAKPAEGLVVASVAPGVEALMREYYLCGRDIARVSDRVLESATIPDRLKPRIQKVDRQFLLWNGKLAVRESRVFRDDPSEMLRYFRVALERKVPLYGHTKELIEAHVANLSPCALSMSPVSSRLFLDALIDLEDDGVKPMLREMHAIGLVSAMIPEFGPCTGRVQHDLYHVYTVDHHQLYAVQLLKKTGRGELDHEGAVAMEAYQELSEVESLYLAMLLHDVAKPLGSGHAANGGVIVARVAKSFGMTEQQAEMANFLVRQHLTMSHISQRRDLSDPEVIEKFAKLVGDADALTKLYLLTRCDTAMTGPRNLSSWKDQLLAELYIRTRDLLRGGQDLESEQAMHRRRTRQRAIEIVSRQGEDLAMVARAQSVVGDLEDSLVNLLSALELVRLIKCILRRQYEKSSVVISAQCIPDRGQTEVICVSEDLPGTVAKVAGVLAAHRVHIDSAAISSFVGVSGPSVVQVFQVRDEFDQAIGSDDRRWARVQTDLQAVIQLDLEQASLTISALLAKREKGEYSVKPQIALRDDSLIKVLDGESSAFSVVEVHTSDAVGILYCITREMAQQGLQIHRALVSTEGDRIADVFYLNKNSNGEKLTVLEGQVLVTALAAALEEF